MMEENNEITNLWDLLEHAIRAYKQDPPKGYIFSVKVTKEAREQIYSDWLSENFLDPPEYNRIDKKDHGFYVIKIFKMKIHLF